jgi:hypothetical protein
MGEGPIVEALFNEHVEAAAKGIERRRDQSLDIFRFAHVGFDREDVCPGGDLPNFIAHTLDGRGVPGGKGKAGGAFACERESQFAAQSLGRAGDQDVFSGQFVHDASANKLTRAKKKPTNRLPEHFILSPFARGR